MAIATAADFVEVLRQVPVLEPAQLEVVTQQLLPQFADPEELARELLRRDWLTAWQIARLVDGRAAELVLGPYVLLQVLGEGGMGSVYQARQCHLHRLCALKVIRKECLTSPDAVVRFQREAHAAARLDHPNVVRVYDAGEADGVHYLAMEYLPGTDLARYLKQRGPLPAGEACDYIRQAALGLQHAHEQGLVHRDIKPSNLMLVPGNGPRTVVKVLDLGLARLARSLHGEQPGDGPTSSGAVMGTPDYLAPEQARNARQVDIRADIYSLGCSLYHLLTGQPPFPGESLTEKLLHHQLDSPAAVEQLRPGLPNGLADVVRRMMAKQPEDRYQAPAEVAQALEPFRSSEPSPAVLPATITVVRPAGRPTITAPTIERRGSNRWRWLLAGCLLLLLGVGTTVWLVSRPPPDDPAPQAHNPDPEPPLDPDPDPPEPEPEPQVKPPMPVPPALTNSIGMQFARIPPGSFWMGGRGGKAGSRQQTIPREFQLGIFPVTQGQWQTVMDGDRPSYFSRKGDGKNKVAKIATADLQQFPVERVSWEDAQRFLKKLNAREKGNGWWYRLPTEVEWEYACRGAPTSPKECGYDFYFDRPTNNLSSTKANFDGNMPAGKAARGPNLRRTTRVDAYPPNRLGLYDMHGNVWQWCADSSGSNRVIRGGCWSNAGIDCRAAHRVTYGPAYRDNALGFRVARVPAAE